VRLVLCDDNRIFCEALAVALEARGHQALAIATTADEGVAAVARHQPDACLLDFRFHEGGDGVGAARAIRDKSPGTAVLVVSDSGSRVASLAATRAGVAGIAPRAASPSR
jgi:DNA-binding NarL/FixJ family response regulator